MEKVIFMVVILASLTTIAFAQTSTKIPYDSLPVSAREHLQKKFSKYQIANIEKSVDTTGTINYIVEARQKLNANTTSVVNLIYSSTGDLLSSKKEKEVSYTGSEPVRENYQNADGHNHQH